MKKQMKWLMAVNVALLSLSVSSCSSDSSDKNEPTPPDQSNSLAYSFFDSANFPQEWMVDEIVDETGDIVYKGGYDEYMRPLDSRWGYTLQYEYEENTCTFTRQVLSSIQSFKGFFEGNKLLKAQWRNFEPSNAIYEGDRLVVGTNGYRLTWDADGNITNYSDGNMRFTYTDIPNKANLDFNMIMTRRLKECWCDDGSEFFTIFGWTGARTTNLVKTYEYHQGFSSDGIPHEFSYTMDKKGRPVKVDDIYQGEVYRTYNITYLAN